MAKHQNIKTGYTTMCKDVQDNGYTRDLLGVPNHKILPTIGPRHPFENLIKISPRCRSYTKIINKGAKSIEFITSCCSTRRNVSLGN